MSNTITISNGLVASGLKLSPIAIDRYSYTLLPALAHHARGHLLIIIMSGNMQVRRG